MNKFTPADLAKIIGLDKETQEKYVGKMNEHDEDMKLEIKKVLWAAFHQLTDELADLKYQQYLEEVKQNKRKLEGDLYDQAFEAVMKDYEEILNGKKEADEQINQLRNKIQGLLTSPPQSLKVS